MFTIDPIGPDAAGKTSIGRRPVQMLPLPVKHLYQGINLDRHFCFDDYSQEIAPMEQGAAQPLAPGKRADCLLSSRLHSYMLERFYPRPDLVILLDTPAEVLFAWNGEGTVERLERRRQEYLEMGKRFENFAIVDATQPRSVVQHDAAALIHRFYATAQNQRGETLSVTP